jgi:hypothetical protein
LEFLLALAGHQPLNDLRRSFVFLQRTGAVNGVELHRSQR